MRLLFTTLLLACLSRQTRAISCDKQLLPELSFRLSGHNVEWPCEATRSVYESTGRHVGRSLIPTRVQMYRDQAILALPRYRPGVPFTLAVTSLKSKRCQPRLLAYPNWPIQEIGNCEALQSVVDVVLDAQDVLWVLDVGVVNTLEEPKRYCPPKIVAINVKNGKVLKTIDLSSLVEENSRLQFLVVNREADGQVYLYVSDAATRSILVYNTSEGSGYRFQLPKAVTRGCRHRDVLYMTLVRKSCGASVIYFTYLGGDRMYSVKTQHLRQGRTSGCIVDVGEKTNKIVVLGNDNGSAIFFRNKGESDVFMWNTETRFKADNFLLVQRGNECRLPTQVAPGYKRLMWVIESNFHDYVQNAVGCAGASVLLHPIVKSSDD